MAEPLPLPHTPTIKTDLVKHTGPVTDIPASKPRRLSGRGVGRTGSLPVPWRVSRWVLAYALVYPVRTGWLVGIAALAWLGTGAVRAVFIAVIAVAVVLRFLRGGILRRSLRDPQSTAPVNPLVKSLQLRRRVRKRWRHAMRRAGLEKAERDNSPAYPVRKRVKITPYGVATRVNMAPIGGTADDLRAKRRSVSATLRARDSRVTETGPGWAELELRHTDPLTGKIIHLGDLPPARKRHHIVTGLDEDGRGVERFMVKSILSVGSPGAGKSSELWVGLAQLIALGVPLRLRVFNPKVMEFASLRDAAYQYEQDPWEWGSFLGTALGALLARQSDFAERGITEHLDFTYRDPFDLMIVDELLTAVAMESNDKIEVKTPGRNLTLPARKAFMAYASQARAAGATVWGASQLGQKTILGPEVVDLFPQRNCLSVPSDDLAALVLNRSAKDYPAHEIPIDPAHAGIGYTSVGPPRGIVRYRGAMLTKAEKNAVVAAIARETKHCKMARPHLAGEGAGDLDESSPTISINRRRRVPRKAATDRGDREDAG